MSKTDDKEREILTKEIAEEYEKIKIEKSIIEIEERLNQYMNSFNESIRLTIENLRSSPYPFDADPSLSKARIVIKEISEILEETIKLEKKLVSRDCLRYPRPAGECRAVPLCPDSRSGFWPDGIGGC
jgi:hypothetical protein